MKNKKKVIIHIQEKIKLIRYCELYSRRNKDKSDCIKMIDKSN